MHTWALLQKANDQPLSGTDSDPQVTAQDIFVGAVMGISL